MKRTLLALLAGLIAMQASAVNASRPASTNKLSTMSVITTIKLNASGDLLSAGYSDGSIVLWDIAEKNRLWTNEGAWKVTSRLGVGPGGAFDDQVVDLSQLPGTKSKKRGNPPVMQLFFMAAGLELLAVEGNGGIRRLFSDSGKQLSAYGIFWGAKKGKQLEGTAVADADSWTSIHGRIIVAGSLTGFPHEINLATLAKTQGSGSYIVLDDWLRRLDLVPGTSFVSEEQLGIGKSPSASKKLLHSSNGRITDIKYCDNGRTVVGTTDNGRLIGWKRSAEQLATSPAYVRLVFGGDHKSGRGATIACAGRTLISTSSLGRYGNLQLWDADEGRLVRHLNLKTTVFGKEIALDRAGSIAAIPSTTGITVWKIDNDQLLPLACLSTIASNKNPGKARKVQNAEARYSVSVSGDGKVLAVADNDGIGVFDLPDLLTARMLGSSSTTWVRRECAH